MDRSFHAAVQAFGLAHKPCLLVAVHMTGREANGTPRCGFTSHWSTVDEARSGQDVLFMLASAKTSYEFLLQTYADRAGITTHKLRGMIEELVQKGRTKSEGGGTG